VKKQEHGVLVLVPTHVDEQIAEHLEILAINTADVPPPIVNSEPSSSTKNSCIETCFLDPTDKPYKFVIEVEPGTIFELYYITYSLHDI